MTDEHSMYFAKGDRVVVVAQLGPNGARVGAVGTVIEDGESCPWVAFDAPTGFDDSIITEACHLEGWKPGHMDSVLSRYIESVET